MASRWRFGARGTLRVWTSRILRRPSLSGGFTVTRRSKRPGRRSAASRISGRLVEASTITPSEPVKPSISVRIWLRVCSRSSCPSKAASPPRARPMASSSSMKMIAGAVSLAWLKRSRTRLAPTPTTIFDELRGRQREEGHVGLAGHRAGQERLARAGRPGEQDALRDGAAEPAVAVGVLEEVDDLDELLLRLLDARDVRERGALLRRLVALGPGAPEAGAEAAAQVRGRPAHEPDEQRDQQEGGTEAEDDGGQEASSSSSGRALTSTSSRRRSANSSSSAKDGRWVSKRLDGSLSPFSCSKRTGLRNSPWIMSPREVTSATLPASACSRKNVWHGEPRRLVGDLRADPYVDREEDEHEDPEAPPSGGGHMGGLRLASPRTAARPRRARAWACRRRAGRRPRGGVGLGRRGRSWSGSGERTAALVARGARIGDDGAVPDAPAHGHEQRAAWRSEAGSAPPTWPTCATG